MDSSFYKMVHRAAIDSLIRAEDKAVADMVKNNNVNKEITMYTVVCDNCGKDASEYYEFSAWSDKLYAQDMAMELGWMKKEDKHYCQDCVKNHLK